LFTPLNKRNKTYATGWLLNELKVNIKRNIIIYVAQVLSLFNISYKIKKMRKIDNKLKSKSLAIRSDSGPSLSDIPNICKDAILDSPSNLGINETLSLLKK
jgi:hypothetical protein